MSVNAIPASVAGSEALSSLGSLAPKSSNGSFGTVIQGFLSDANAQQLQADQAIQRLASGQTDSVHETMLALAKADLSFRVFVEVQGKVVEAYQDVMRMQM